MITKGVRKALRALARKYRISLIVLFGSEGRDKGRPGSDVDLAVWMDKPLTPSRELSLLAEMGECFPGRMVDVAILNQASPLLRFQVAKEGVLLYEQRSGGYIRFKLLAMKQFWETAKFRRARAEYLRKAAQTE